MAIQVGGGDNDYFFTTSVIPASSSVWTAMCWVKFADTTLSAFIGLGPSSTGVFYRVAAASGGGTLDYFQGSTNVQGGTITTGTWYHVAIVANGTDVRVYLNGVLVITGSLNGSITPGRVEFGGVGSTGEGHRGDVAQCRLFDAALNATAIQAEMANSHAMAANCIGDWPMHMPGFGLYNIAATDTGFSSQFPANTYNLAPGDSSQGTFTPGPSQSVFDFLQAGPMGRNIGGTSDPVVSALTSVLSGSLLIAGGATYQASGTATVGASAVADGTNTWVRAEEITQGGDPIAVAAYYALAAAAGSPNVTLTPSSGRWSIVAAAEFKQPATVVVETPVEGQSLASPQDLTGGTPSGANNISILAATWYDDGRPAVTGWTPLALHPNFNNSGGSQTLGLWFRIQKTATAPSASIRYYTGTIGNAAVMFTISEAGGADTTMALTAGGALTATANLSTTPAGMQFAGTARLTGAASLTAPNVLALAATGRLTATANLSDAVYPNAFLRIDDDNSVFIDLPSMPSVGDTIFVAMDAWQWTTPPSGQGVDPQSSWLTDNNGASAGDYQREAIVLATDGRAQASINTPGVAIFRRVVTSVANSPYRITAAGAFDWGGIGVLAVPGVIDAPPQAWAKDWRPSATIGGIPPNITFGTIASTSNLAIQLGAAHNSGHGNGIDGPGEGTVYPPAETGKTGFVVVGMEGHNSLHLSFHFWYRVVRAVESMTPLMLLEDLDGATFTACRGVQAVYGLSGGVGSAIELSVDAIARHVASLAISAAIRFGVVGQAFGQGAASLTAPNQFATAATARGTAAAALTAAIQLATSAGLSGSAAAALTTAIPLALGAIGRGQAAVGMGGTGEMATAAVTTHVGQTALTNAIGLQVSATGRGTAAAALEIAIRLAVTSVAALSGAAALSTGNSADLAVAAAAGAVASAALQNGIVLQTGAVAVGSALITMQTAVTLAAVASASLAGQSTLVAGPVIEFALAAGATGVSQADLAASIRLALGGSATLHGEAAIDAAVTMAAAGLLELIGSTNLMTVAPRVYATISVQLENGELVGVVQLQRISGTLEILS